MTLTRSVLQVPHTERVLRNDSEVSVRAVQIRWLLQGLSAMGDMEQSQRWVGGNGWERWRGHENEEGFCSDLKRGKEC